MKKDWQLNEVLEEQAKRRSTLSHPKREAEVTEALTENRQTDRDPIKEVTDQVFKARKLSISERIEHEDSQESINSKQAKLTKTKSVYNQRTLRLGEDRLEPDFKDNLTRGKLKQPKEA
ncbi:hypothetical protein CCH79_00000281 [Gambusia affinis]|uniref:Uncharacterized protein n=1 Tax=Gambusia affinis TaxID=33528 RepID=A0A315VVV6_GAMAF|nr:hypothetical protein CCH79_00000281 [Gambusia affinis]